MLRVAQLIEALGARAGGTSSAFMETLAALATQRDRVALAAYAPDPPENDPVHERIAQLAGDVRWRPTGPIGALRAGDLARRVVADVEAGRVDVLHIHGVWSSDLVAAARACREVGVPYCWQPHGMLLNHAIAHKRLKKEMFLRLGLARALARADAVLFASEAERRDSVLPRRAPRDRRHVIGLAVALDDSGPDRATLAAEGRARFGLAPTDEVVVFVGRLHPVKRLEMTLDAVAQLRRGRANVRLLVLGAGDDDYAARLRARAADPGLDGVVVFAGWTVGEDKWRGLACADVLVMNSLHENFGYGIVEALAVGTPVVVTENLSLADEVRRERAGSVVAPTSDGIARGLASLLSSDARSDQGESGRAWVLRTYARDRVGARLADLYGRLRDARSG